jgi:NAD(P)-dependent dehydrogenase (short-subunit alcohol dehydrogenase family)
MAPYLLTRLLLPLMERGTRIVNMVSCTYAIGRLDFPDFFTRGRKGGFWRIPIYSNTKLALLLFTLSMAKRLEGTGITINAADPGVVSTPIIAMHAWFDPLTDIFFRPFIRTPRQGADTAIRLLLDAENEGKNGTFNLSGHTKALSKRFTPHRQAEELWNETESRVKKYL